MERVDVAVIGGGQAGLAVSHELAGRGIEHVVLERGRIGQTWRGRWDSFCLVTPNWTVQLPGGGYEGPEPDGYMPRDDIVAHLERYASGFTAPVREGVEVVSVGSHGDGFVVETSSGDLHAGSIVVATGAYQRPHRPAVATTLPADLLQIDVDDYRNERALPSGRVLIVGSGQSGCQIAEELHEAGRDVVLSCGRAPWVPRRIGEHDIVWWGVQTGYLDARVESLPEPGARLAANLLATGHGGGHDLHLRTLRAMGVTLVGHFVGTRSGSARFAPDLGESLAWGDERHRMLMDLVRNVVAERGLETPEFPEIPPFDDRAPAQLDLSDVGAVVFAGGFRPDYSWLPWPEAFDPMGFPIHDEGASTVVPGLYFVGVHFLRKRKSSLLIGVGEDAAIVAGSIAAASPVAR
jgi:cation diffusion facilitator CzcD-associated flavoprotein CzcO